MSDAPVTPEVVVPDGGGGPPDKWRKFAVPADSNEVLELLNARIDGKTATSFGEVTTSDGSFLYLGNYS